MPSTHRDLVAWQRAMDLAVQIFKLTASFPPEERYGLSAQMRRAATSIPSNIAEGHGRSRSPEFAHFLRISRGSLRELETQTDLALRLDYLTTDQFHDVASTCDAVGRVLTGLINAQTRTQTPSHDQAS